MLVVNLSKSWPKVLNGVALASDVTLCSWASITDDSLDKYADVVLGVYQGVVVSAFDITGWERIPDGEWKGRVTFFGVESKQWAGLIGQPNPTTPWVQGSARPVKYLLTSEFLNGSATVEEDTSGRRAVIDGYVLSVSLTGEAYLQVPMGKNITVMTI